MGIIGLHQSLIRETFRKRDEGLLDPGDPRVVNFVLFVRVVAKSESQRGKEVSSVVFMATGYSLLSEYPISASSSPRKKIDRESSHCRHIRLFYRRPRPAISSCSLASGFSGSRPSALVKSALALPKSPCSSFCRFLRRPVTCRTPEFANKHENHPRQYRCEEE